MANYILTYVDPAVVTYAIWVVLSLIPIGALIAIVIIGVKHVKKRIRTNTARNAEKDLLTYKQLLDSGAITQDIYDAKRNELLMQIETRSNK